MDLNHHHRIGYGGSNAFLCFVERRSGVWIEGILIGETLRRVDGYA